MQAATCPILFYRNKVTTVESNALAGKLVELIDTTIATSVSIPIIGLSGPQGSGKSTALNIVCEQSRYRIASLGLDDFYLPKADRLLLSDRISPLFATRGPPGTHDLNLLDSTIDSLLKATSQSRSLIPGFDKALDDRLPKHTWYSFTGVPDAIVLECWMVGATLPPNFLASAPMNQVEAQDKNSVWRQEQAEQLAGPYQSLWGKINQFIHITGPEFSAVKKWRLEQEASNQSVALGELSEERQQWVAEFIQYFERITVAMQDGYKREGVTLLIDAERQYLKLTQP